MLSDGSGRGSPAAVDRRRPHELNNAEKMVAVELRMAEQDRLAKLRMERREQTEELANRALGFVDSKLDPKWIDEKLRGGLGNSLGGSKPGGASGTGSKPGDGASASGDAADGAADKGRDPDNPYGRLTFYGRQP